MKKEIINFFRRNNKNLISAIQEKIRSELKKEENKEKWKEKNHIQKDLQEQKNQEDLLDR